MPLTVQAFLASFVLTTVTLLFIAKRRREYDLRHGSTLPKSSRPATTGVLIPKVLKVVDITKRFSRLLWPGDSFALRMCSVGCLLCVAFGRAANVFIPLQLGLALDNLHDPNVGPPFKEIIAYIMGRIVSSRMGISTFQRFFWSRLEIHGLQKLSTSAYAHHMSLSKDYHEGSSSQRITQSIQSARSIIALLRIVYFQLVPLGFDIVIGAGYLGRMIDDSLASIAFATIASILLLTWVTSHRTAPLQRKYVEAMGTEHRILTETSSNWATVAYFDQFSLERQRYSSALYNAQSYIAKYFLADDLLDGLKQVTGIVGLGTACCLAAYRIKQRGKSGDLATLIVYWGQLLAPLETVSFTFAQISRSLVDAEKLIELFEMPPAILEAKGALPLTVPNGKVRFKDVCFSYREESTVLNNMSFSVRGGTIGIVGSSGAGKTTILDVLFRFHDVKGGRIEIDDQDISQVTIASLRRAIAVVPQTPALFNTTILENLQYSRADTTVSVEECEGACHLAMIHDTIVEFPDGYNTIVGERGAKLSGGQLQRIAIAQALLKTSPILLLDEASSNLDSATEARIHKNIRRHREHCTVFIVAHRLSTVVTADQILVVDKGGIVESGTHESLLARQGHYHRLWTAFATSGQSAADS